MKRSVAWSRGNAMLVLGMAVVLLVAGVLKLRDEYAFLDAVYDYRLVSVEVGLLIAAVLPWVEIAVACLLLAGLFQRAALWIAFGLFLVFASVQMSAVVRGLDIACACFGGDARIDMVSILRSLLLAAVTGLSLWMTTRGLAQPDNVPVPTGEQR